MITLNLEDSDYRALLALVKQHDPSARLQFVLEDSTVVSNRREARAASAANVLSSVKVGDTVRFPYDNVFYTAIITKINDKTAKVQITKIEGSPRRAIFVGQTLGVPASILARGM